MLRGEQRGESKSEERRKLGILENVGIQYDMRAKAKTKKEEHSIERRCERRKFELIDKYKVHR